MSENTQAAYHAEGARGEGRTNRDKVVLAMSSSLDPLDDDELSRRSGVMPRQSVNMPCRELEKQGVVRRFMGSDGKLVNELLERRTSPSEQTADSHPLSRGDDRREAALPSAGDSTEQRHAERLMLDALGDRLRVTLNPRRMVHPTGSWVEIDGADEALSVLVECWAHQGPAKSAQKSKLLLDATKLNWIAKSLRSAPPRLILCLSDAAAMSHLNGTSWQAQAIRELGVEIEIVTLDSAIITELVAAQRRQFR
jgi:hypothetical protein